jgi:hypothetical protein
LRSFAVANDIDDFLVELLDVLWVSGQVVDHVAQCVGKIVDGCKCGQKLIPSQFVCRSVILVFLHEPLDHVAASNRFVFAKSSLLLFDKKSEPAFVHRSLTQQIAHFGEERGDGSTQWPGKHDEFIQAFDTSCV